MKIIFLDLDGVLNHESFYMERFKLMHIDQYNIEYPYSEFSPESIKWINKLTDITDAKIVISGKWRVRRTLQEIRNIFQMVGITGDVIDKTPTLYYTGTSNSVTRGSEVENWLSNMGFRHIHWNKNEQIRLIRESGIENYIILDDDQDFLYTQRNHFIHIPYPPKHKSGFDEKYFNIALEKLNQDIIILNNENWN